MILHPRKGNDVYVREMNHFSTKIMRKQYLIIPALFTIKRKQNQTSFPSTDEWIMKIWYMLTYICEYYLSLKKNKIAKFAGKWMVLECIISKQGDMISEKKKNSPNIAAHVKILAVLYISP